MASGAKIIAVIQIVLAVIALAPELFDVDDYGTATALNDGVVPAGMEEKAHLAIANCPEHAITIVED